MSSLQRQLFEKHLPSLPPFPPSGSHSKKSGRGWSIHRGVPNWILHSNPCLYTSELASTGQRGRIKTILLNLGATSMKATEALQCTKILGSDGPVLFLLHGGGHSALSWAVFAVAVAKLVVCQVVAMDFRGHGKTTTDNDSDLSGDTLTKDVVDVIATMYPDGDKDIILIGHSMGGAIAVRAAATGLVSSLAGVIVIDVVEGTAVESLPSMQSFLKGLPTSFRSMEHAIEWSINSGHIRNLDSAKVSMPGQIKKVDTPFAQPSAGSEPQSSGILREEDEEIEQNPESTACSDLMPPPSIILSKSRIKYTWQIDLSKTELFWKGWFQGLSKLFLSISVPKMLLLAAVGTLDRELTIGHMQGKFQMQVLSGSGHLVHEDQPEKVAEAIASFMVRYKVTSSKEAFQSSLSFGPF